MSNQNENAYNDAIVDGCPDWAVDLIRKIYLLEIESGAIKNPKSKEWSTATQEELLKVADTVEKSMGVDIEEETAALFERVTRGLSSEDFTPDEIAQMINVRVPTGCNLKYCNASEVLASL